MEEKPDTWIKRRRLMWTIVGFCMGTISYVLWQNMTSEPAEAAVTMAFGILGATIASYVFGAVWDDKNK